MRFFVFICTFSFRQAANLLNTKTYLTKEKFSTNFNIIFVYVLDASTLLAHCQ